MSIRLLGPPEIRRAGRRVDVDTRKAIALLAYLVVSGPAVTRDQAAALLWPEHEHSRARAALRRTLTTLRRAIGAEHLDTTRHQIELLPDRLDVDVLRFEELAAATDRDSLHAAWDLYRGDLLLGFGLRDSADFDDWQRREGERLRGIATDVLDRLARAAEQQGAVAEAVQYAEARVSLDPLSEPGHRRLMELEARRGERAAAVARYRTLVRTLDDALGMEPRAETTAAYEAIRRGETPPKTAPAAPPSAGSPLPFCGRDNELAAILAAIPRTRTHGYLVLIEGDAGMGATRLLHEAADRLRGSGAVVTSVRCHAHEAQLAYASIVSLIRGLVGGRNAADLDLPRGSSAQVAGLMPELGIAETPAAGAFRFYEALTDVILALAPGAGPPVLVIDDVHRIDPASRSYLTFLANRLATIPVAIVATVHPDEADPADPLLLLAGDLARGEAGTIIGIGALDADDTAELAASAGCDDVDPAELWRATGGIPLYLAEYLRSGCEGARHAGAVPSVLVPVVAARLDRLGPAAGQVLAVVAVLAEPAAADLIRRVAGRSMDEVAEGIDALVRAGVVIADEQGRYTTANTLTERVTYERIGQERRRLLHHRAAQALEGRAGDRASAAHHFRRSGHSEAAARAYAAAGDDARGVFANEAARSHYRAALNLGHPQADRLRESIADLATSAGRYSEARHYYELVAATRTGADLARVEEKLGLLHLRLGHPEIAVSHFQSALVEADADEAVTARVLANCAAAHSAAGDVDAATAAVDAARRAADRTRDRAALAAVENVRGLIARRNGDFAAAREAFELSLHLAEIHGDTPLEIAAANNLALALTEAGRRDRARELFESALELALRAGEEHRAAAIHSNLADLLQQDGDTAAAAGHIRRMAELMAEVGGQFDEPTPGVWMQTAW